MFSTIYISVCAYRPLETKATVGNGHLNTYICMTSALKTQSQRRDTTGCSLGKDTAAFVSLVPTHKKYV